MTEHFKPIYLFADSQLLFWQLEGTPFLLSLRKLIEARSPKAAYVGASNDDNPVFYGIFESAMEGIGIKDCRMISASFSKDEESFVGEADLVLLAGGDVEKGWRAFEQSGFKDLVYRRYAEGVVLVGISAGAVQLGMLGCAEADPECEHLFNTFRLVPFIIGAHEEKDDWRRLKRAMQRAEIRVKGIGIPGGGGMVYHADHSVEPIRHPLHEFSLEGDQIRQGLIFPGDAPILIEAPGVY